MSQQQWKERASRVLPAGGFGNFDPGIVIREGREAHVWDEDGNRYIDYLIGSGPMLLGHGHPDVLNAVREQLDLGTTFFANNARGIELAEVICDAMACAEQLRYVSTGGEADMYAMRLARAYTGRDKIVKFEGGYHGMSAEALMSLSPKQLKDFPSAVPDSAGIPESVREHMLIAPFNDLDFVRDLMREHAGTVAAIIAEPLQRLLPPAPGFLQGLRDLADEHDVVLVFDEVVTGFRFAYGGAQAYYGVTPDVCTLGKIIGGGFPLAAITGKADIMAHFDVSKVGQGGFTFQVGTLSGNPVAAAAGLKTLELLRAPGAYDELETTGRFVMQAMRDAFSEHQIAHQIVGEPMLFDVVFSETEVRDYRGLLSADAERAKVYNKHMRASGILKADAKIYPSLALTDDDLQDTKLAIENAAGKLT